MSDHTTFKKYKTFSVFPYNTRTWEFGRTRNNQRENEPVIIFPLGLRPLIFPYL